MALDSKYKNYKNTEMRAYTYTQNSTQSYLDYLYKNGLKKSCCLQYDTIEEILNDIGIFKFKGYIYALKHNITDYSIDDALILYFFDKYITRITMELTFSIETKIKTLLIESCYAKTDNPFFYLIKDNHKYRDFKLNQITLNNWKQKQNYNNINEGYLHYNIYYKSKYDFNSNKLKFLQDYKLITIEDDINYPPFHYLIESATLGSIIFLIKSLKIDNYDILHVVGSAFGVNNPRTFKPYLERLNEVRNRAAHRERLFNRSYRSVRGVNQFKILRADINNHKFIDVYMFLFFMLGLLDEYQSYNMFQRGEIKRLFYSFRHDYFICKSSKYLIKKVKRKKIKRMMNFIYERMV